MLACAGSRGGEFKRQHRAAEADPPANPLPRRLEFE